jgi:hypothetical protein
MKAPNILEPKPIKAFRDKYLAAVMMVAALFICAVSSAQTDSTKYSQIKGYGFKYKRMAFDSTLMAPLSTSPHTPYRPGGIRYRASDSTLQLWTGNQWLSIITGVGNGIDTAYMVNDTILVIETPDQDFMLQVSKRHVDTLYRKPGQDSIFYQIAGVERSILDSINHATQLTDSTFKIGNDTIVIRGAVIRFGIEDDVASGNRRFDVNHNDFIIDSAENFQIIATTNSFLGGKVGIGTSTPAGKFSIKDTLTGSDTTYSFKLEPTWNTSGITKGFYMNVTNTASNSNSKVVDIRQDASTRFSIDRNAGVLNVLAGGIRVNGTGGAGGISFGASIPAANNILGTTGLSFTVSSTPTQGTYIFSLPTGYMGPTTGLYRTFTVSNGSTSQGFTPSSGTAEMTVLDIMPGVNQTGTASGTTRGIRVDSSNFVAATQFRSIDLNLNKTGHYGIYQSGALLSNLFNGSVTIGSSLYATAGSFSKVRTITADATIAVTDNTILIDATGGNVTITLPAASAGYNSTLNVGIVYKFQRIDNSGNTVTIQRAGSDTINGTTSYTLTTQYEVKQTQATSTTTWAQW